VLTSQGGHGPPAGQYMNGQVPLPTMPNGVNPGPRGPRLSASGPGPMFVHPVALTRAVRNVPYSVNPSHRQAGGRTHVQPLQSPNSWTVTSQTLNPQTTNQQTPHSQNQTPSLQQKSSTQTVKLHRVPSQSQTVPSHSHTMPSQSVPSQTEPTQTVTYQLVKTEPVEPCETVMDSIVSGNSEISENSSDTTVDGLGTELSNFPNKESSGAGNGSEVDGLGFRVKLEQPEDEEVGRFEITMEGDGDSTMDAGTTGSFLSSPLQQGHSKCILTNTPRPPFFALEAIGTTAC